MQKSIQKIKSITRNDGEIISLSVGALSIVKETMQGVKGYCVQIRNSDNELTIANSDKRYKFIPAACVSEVHYLESEVS